MGDRHGDDLVGPVLGPHLLKAGPHRNHDWASVLLGQAYEETGQFQKALDLYTKALTLYPNSIHLTQIRNRLRRLPAAQAAADAKKTTAVVPKQRKTAAMRCEGLIMLGTL